MNTVPLLKETDELIQYCKNEKLVYCIKDAVDEWLEFYTPDSSGALVRLMSRMEDKMSSNQTQLFTDVQAHLPLLKQEYSLVTELPIKKHDKGLYYAFLLLVDKCECKKEKGTDYKSEHTFKTFLVPIKLVKLWRFLKEHHFCSESSYHTFKFVLSGEAYEKKSVSKMEWSQRYLGKNNISGLIAMLQAICPESAFKDRKAFFYKTSELFCFPDATITVEQVRSAFYKMNESPNRNLATKKLLSFIEHLMQGD